MNIAFFHHTLRLGSGIDTVIFELANRLSKYENVTVFCFRSDYKEDDYSFRIRVIRSKFANTTGRMMVLSPLVLDKVGPLLDEMKKFDIVNTHHYPANYIVRNIVGPLNVVTEWSAASSSLFSTFKEKWFLKWVTYANKMADRKAELLIAPCDFVRRWIVENYSINAETLLMDGVNFEMFDREKVNSDRIRTMYPKIGNKKIVLFVGRITESKNIHSLIDAFEIVKRNVPETVLILVGNYQSYPIYYDRLIRLVKTKHLMDDVIFTGIVSWDDLPSFFAGCSVYATCSLWEGFLRAEPFAFSKPIICFDKGANYETVHDGDNGFIIRDSNVSEFASRLEQLLCDESLSKAMGEKGYRWAKENLDFNVIASRFRDLCKVNFDEKN